VGAGVGTGCQYACMCDVFYAYDTVLARVGLLAMALCVLPSGLRILDLSYNPTLCSKEIQVSSKLRVLPCGTLLQTLDLQNFATAYRSSKRVINLARERWTLRA